MQFTPIVILDRMGGGTLHAQLLSSQTSGTFQIDTASALGTQLVTQAATVNEIVTLENEQILCSAFSVSGSTVTCTIATNGRGYNGTQAATHSAGVAVEMHYTKGHEDNKNNHLNRFDDNGLIMQFPGIVPTIVSASQHTISSATDYSSYFVAGRAYLFKVGSTWYRGIVTSATFGASTTTINFAGDGLIGSGTVASWGFEFTQSIYGGVDYDLVKAVTNSPTTNPPSGYQWLWAKAGGWMTRNSSGVVRFLCKVTASVSSSAGVLSLDCSTANYFECTLTENITQVTWTNGMDGEEYFIRFRQAAGLYTVALNTAGGTRFSNSISSYVVTATNGAVDYLRFMYNGTDSKFDIVNVSQGSQTSPVAIVATPPGVIMPYGGNAAPSGFLMCDGTAVSRTTYNALFAILAPSLGNPTMTIASPCVVTLSAHGLQTGDSLYFTTSGALPTGLVINTRYWVIKIDANTFNLATSLANALAATKINTSGSQSGTHTATLIPYGIGDGTTTFNTPDLRGNVAMGRNVNDALYAGGLGETGGENTHVLSIGEMPAHTHTYLAGSASGGSAVGPNTSIGTSSNTGSQGSGTAHNNLQPYVTTNYIIKT